MINSADVREHMDVRSSDGHPVGRVDHVKAEQIELAKLDLATMGVHRYTPLSWVDDVDGDKIHLAITKAEAKARWV